MDCPDPGTSEHRDCSFGNGRQIDDDAITFSNLVSLENIGETTDLAVQLIISQRASLARFALPKKSRLIASWSGQMPIETILRNVQLPTHKPFGERSFPIEHPVPGFVPGQFFRFARPKFIRLLDRFPVHFPVLLQTLDSGMPLKIFGWLEDAFFDQVRFDVRFHQRKSTLATSLEGLNGFRLQRCVHH